jgi:WD40 repeat protein
MEIDHPDASNNNNNHAYPSPLEGEQAASPLPRTEGPDKGTQVEKVNELTQETVFLRLGADDSSEANPPPTNENPIVLQCEWNPQDPSLLAASGTDALARIWTLSRGAVPDTNSIDHVNGISQPFRKLIDDDVPRNATITAMAWNVSGDAIALAIEIENKTRISILGIDGTNIYRIDGIEPPVIRLRWSPNNDYILGISPENGGTLLTVLSSSMAQSRSHVVEHNLLVDPLDAAWIDDVEFVLCGGDTLVSFRCTDQGIVQNRQFQTQREEAFTHVQFDPKTKLIATASDKGQIDVSFGSCICW